MKLTRYESMLIASGQARLYRGRLIPVMRGAENDDAPLFAPIPENLSDLSLDELSELETSIHSQLQAISAAPDAFVSADFSAQELVSAARDARAGLNAVRDAIAALSVDETDDEEAEGDAEPETEPEAEAAIEVDETAAAELAELAAEPEPVVEPPAAVEPEPVVAAAVPAVAPLRPARSAAAAPVPSGIPRVSLTAATGALSGIDLGGEITSQAALGDLLIKQHRKFGAATGDKHVVARADWSDNYPSARRLGGDVADNMALIAAATDPAMIKAELKKRQKSLTAAGGWCAPVTPYYDLQTFGTTDRPVRNALPGFDASRGGIRHGRPASLGAINDAVGIVTAEEDAQGGTFAAKSCQIVDCPDFVEVQANAVYHCLQFGNMVSRAYPELVANWNSLTQTALARLAESYLLTRIDSLSTQVTADGVELGATSTLIPQIVTAAVAMRSRHRMDEDMVLRVMLPSWAVPLMVTDVIKSQFDRFTTDAAKLTAVLRSFNIEPTFYKDSAAGRGQVFGQQADDTALLAFPTQVTWYMFPEGSFIYLDAGTLEIGLVRDSALNMQNDFQLFGEFFENVAFVGVEALAVDSQICNSGVVASPGTSTCPVDFA